MSDKPTQILMIDDHPLALHAFEEVIRREIPDVEFVAATNSASGLEHVWAQEFDLIILDLSLGGRNGLEVLEDIRRHSPKTPVLIVSMHPEEIYGVRALRAGANGYVRKDAPLSDAMDAVRRVLDGKRYISGTLAQDLANYIANDSVRPAHDRLSRREFEVLCLIGKGLSIKQIADQLNLSVKTVSTYRTRILNELGLDSTAALIRFTLEANLLEETP